MDHDEIMRMASVLDSYSYLDGTECGEYWQIMSNLASRTDHMGESFRLAYEQEMVQIEKDLNENYEVVEEIIHRQVTVSRLEYIG